MRAIAIAVGVTLAGTAHADPSDIIARPLVLAPGHVDAELTAEINASEGLVGSPLSIAPDVWVGVSPQLTIGLVHSNPSVDRIAAGASFCLRRDLLDCDDFYHGSGLDLLWSARSGRFAVAPRVRVLVRDLSPFRPATTFGAAIRWTSGRYAISGDPFLQIGLDNNEQGNRSALWLPIVGSIQPTCRWAIDLHTGWNSDLVVWRDGWHVPAELGVRARATSHLDVSGAFGFRSILGPQNTPKERVVFVTAGWRT